MSRRWQACMGPALWVLLLSGGLLLGHGFPHYDEGPLGLALALRKLPVSGSLLHTAAHPDDEDNGLLVMMSRGRGLRTGLLTLTRGDGGQNEIGPELFQAIGIIRTGELLSMHRWTGAQQFFTRAYEFGYSFSVEETLQKWGREEILADMVRLIRRFRPDVIISLNRAGTGGGQHHQTSARLTQEAFRAAGDPARFPQQLAEGLHPWQALKLYERYGGGGRRGGRAARPEPESGVATMQTGTFDPLFDRTYAELGTEARSMHKCQGMAQLEALPGPRNSQWKLVDSVIEGAESQEDLMDGVEIGLKAIWLHAGAEQDRVPFLAAEIDRLQALIDEIQQNFVMTEPAAVVKPLARGLSLLREVRNRITTSTLSEEKKYQVGFLLEKKEADFVKALALARQFRMEVLVEDGLVVPGQTFDVTVTATNASAETLEFGRLDLATPGNWGVTPPKDVPSSLAPQQTASWTYAVQVGPGPRYTGPFWHTNNDPAVDRFDIEEGADVNAPWSAPSVEFTAELRIDGVPVPVPRRAEYRYPGPWVGGEQRHELMVVPAVSLTMTPGIGILRLDAASQGFEVRVTSLYNGQQPANGRVSLQAPPGWRIEPAFQTLEFELEGQSITRRFRVYPGGRPPEGTYPVSATAELGGERFQSGYQVIDYDHIERRHLYHPARTELRAVDVQVAPDLKVAYVVGVGDEVPPALRQLGLSLTFLTEDELAFGDLSRFDTIVTGVRAYLNREDLKANNARLLAWVEAGGTLLVQYNKFEFNRGRGDSPYAPFPLQVSSGRVTDENAPVKVLAPDNPVFLTPNRIGASDWSGWVQERGLYFIGEKSDRYLDLVSTADPFEYNSGEKLGSLVEARYGEGRWIYVGLGLWRQLPAGVPGAFRLLANLVSLGREGS